ncbi:hypothetical protein [Actinomadura violacea]|uniref:Uncharacterized protein n=1 Tax=Actinomadura violacea TaxID=2819934 RepID=A0ABS3SAZ8_9ACTN|nr:hypothetical protein [Actinomadura violacea]MBO2466157.1 hypothetical protein [Actinomadura violacea]
MCVARPAPATVQGFDVHTGRERRRSIEVTEEPTIATLNAGTGKTLWRWNGHRLDMLAANSSSAR